MSGEMHFYYIQLESFLLYLLSLHQCDLTFVPFATSMKLKSPNSGDTAAPSEEIVANSCHAQECGKRLDFEELEKVGGGGEEDEWGLG